MSVGAGVGLRQGITLGTVKILCPIPMLTLFTKDGLPGRHTKASNSLLHPLLLLLILFGWYEQSLFPWGRDWGLLFWA